MTFAEIVSITSYLFSPHNPNWDPRVWYARGDEVRCLGELAIVERVTYITITVRWPVHANTGVDLDLDGLMDAGAIAPATHRLFP